MLRTESGVWWGQVGAAKWDYDIWKLKELTQGRELQARLNTHTHTHTHTHIHTLIHTLIHTHLRAHFCTLFAACALLAALCTGRTCCVLGGSTGRLC
eukprot:1976306-Rhodomonas_salina.1